MALRRVLDECEQRNVGYENLLRAASPQDQEHITLGISMKGIA